MQAIFVSLARVYMQICILIWNHLTLALASRVASASVAMALCNWMGSLTSLNSTLSTSIPYDILQHFDEIEIKTF